MKGRYWLFIIYPDSLPDNYIEIIEETGIPMAISPLHDRDMNPDGTPKKPHYHVLCYYNGPTTYNNVKKNLCDLLNGTIPKKCDNVRGSYRYHIHIDNPEKAQYDDKDRQFFNGFDKKEIEKLTSTEIFKLKRSIIDIIIEKDFYEYSDIVNFLSENEFLDMLDVCLSNTIFFNSYISSRRNKLKDSQKFLALGSQLVDLRNIKKDS